PRGSSVRRASAWRAKIPSLRGSPSHRSKNSFDQRIMELIPVRAILTNPWIGATSMLGNQSWWAAGLMVVLDIIGNAATFAAEPKPEEVLNERGLARSGLLYVLGAEADFLQGVGKLQPSYQQLNGLYEKLAAIARNQLEYDQLDDQWTLVNERLRNVQAEIDTHPPLSNNVLKQNWYDLLDSERQLRYQYNEL